MWGKRKNLVPIVIPFFREHEKLKKCLAAIAAQTHGACEPFVRDNTHDNILFTAAVNEGLAKYAFRPEIRYVMVLNQDAYLQKDCVRTLVEFMDRTPDCGIACPLQFQPSFAGPRVTWGGSLKAFPFGSHRADSFASYGEPVETPWANGACMMIRTATIREVGLFDRNMRFICSDSDFSFTVRARGWKIHVVPKALAEHGLGASGQASVNPELDLVKLRDALYFAQKWLTGGVYRSLAFEGPELTEIGVRQHVQRIQYGIRMLEQQLAKQSAPELPQGLMLVEGVPTQRAVFSGYRSVRSSGPEFVS